MITREKREELLRTLAFFSFFPYPLTRAEAGLYSAGIADDEVAELLGAWEREGIVDVADGMVSLRGTKTPIREQVAERGIRYLDSMVKLRKIRPYLSYLARLPWIEGIALCNSIAWQFTRPESDTDLVLFVKPGHLYTARLFVVPPLMLLRLRPKRGRIHAIDTNFFIASDALDLSALREGNDPYFTQWMRALIPVFERKTGLFERFFGVNSWSRAHSRAPSDTPVRYRIPGRFVLPFWFPERIARFIQERWFPQVIQETRNTGTSVVTNESMLKFHKNDRRAEIARHVAFVVSLWSSKI